MEPMKEGLKTLWTKAQKFKYPLLVLLLGLIFLCVPKEQEEPATQEVPAETFLSASVEQQLEEILGQINGVGKVQVMLTLAAGEETVYQSDENSSGNSTVLYGTGSSREEALVRQTIPETYRGAVVVCQGADNAAVRLSVVQAVAALTGLGAYAICVIKMK